MGSKKKRPVANPRLDFDGIANKFDKNIYGTSKGRLRHQLLLHYLQTYLTFPQALKVLDAGGGTGVMSEAFLQQGHSVKLIDSSSDVLEIASQRLSGYPKCNVEQNNILNETLDEQNQAYDLVLCHAVLEWLPNPMDVIAHIVNTLLKPDGILSLSFFNHDAMLLNNVLYGNFDYVKAGLKVRNEVRLNPHNPQKPKQVIDFLENTLNSTILHHAGIRCFHDYMLDKSKIESEFDGLYEMEATYGTSHPFKWIGKYCHLIVKKPLTPDSVIKESKVSDVC